jgi:hypothetical protein
LIDRSIFFHQSRIGRGKIRWGDRFNIVMHENRLLGATKHVAPDG